MLDDAIKKIEDAVLKLGSLDSAKKKELLGLLSDLKGEVSRLARPDQEPSQSLVGLEASHPKLVKILNDIATALSHIGI